MSSTDYECVTCRGILTGGRCTNEPCPGYVAREDPMLADLRAEALALCERADRVTWRWNGVATEILGDPEPEELVAGLAATLRARLAEPSAPKEVQP